MSAGLLLAAGCRIAAIIIITNFIARPAQQLSCYAPLYFYPLHHYQLLLQALLLAVSTSPAPLSPITVNNNINQIGFNCFITSTSNSCHQVQHLFLFGYPTINLRRRHRHSTGLPSVHHHRIRSAPAAITPGQFIAALPPPLFFSSSTTTTRTTTSQRQLPILLAIYFYYLFTGQQQQGTSQQVNNSLAPAANIASALSPISYQLFHFTSGSYFLICRLVSAVKLPTAINFIIPRRVRAAQLLLPSSSSSGQSAQCSSNNNKSSQGTSQLAILVSQRCQTTTTAIFFSPSYLITGINNNKTSGRQHLTFWVVSIFGFNLDINFGNNNNNNNKSGSTTSIPSYFFFALYFQQPSSNNQYPAIRLLLLFIYFIMGRQGWLLLAIRAVLFAICWFAFTHRRQHHLPSSPAAAAISHRQILEQQHPTISSTIGLEPSPSASPGNTIHPHRTPES